MTFRVGQKVVCITIWGTEKIAARLGVLLPRKGSVYIVRNFDDRGSCSALRVREILNPEIMHLEGIFAEPAFACIGFRPVVSRKTSIEIFTKLLTPSPARSRELCGND